MSGWCGRILYDVFVYEIGEIVYKVGKSEW